jgi:hypothetical protein
MPQRIGLKSFTLGNPIDSVIHDISLTVKNLKKMMQG